MKLTKDQVIEAGILIAGKVSSTTTYPIKILETICDGEHFHVYLGEDAQGTQVCLKTIRYRSEKKDTFGSAAEYIQYRRNKLQLEQRLLAISHPAIPEPLAMLAIPNHDSEDQKLFRRVPEWEQLRTSELILVEEFFHGPSLQTIKNNKNHSFSLRRRIAIASKIAYICKYLNENGCQLSNLHPDHILIDPDSDDNVYLIGFQHGVLIPPDLNPEMLEKPTWWTENPNLSEYQPGLDCAEFGKLLCFLLTIHDSPKDGWWDKLQDLRTWEELRARLRRAMRSFPVSAQWLCELIEELLQPEPELRIPNWQSILEYLERPPYLRPSMQVVSASPQEIKIRVEQPEEELSRLLIQVRAPGYKLVRQQRPYLPELLLPGVGIGTAVVSLAVYNRDDRLSWWQHQKIQVFPALQIKLKNDLGPDKFGFIWETLPNLSYVKFTAIDKQNHCIELGQYTGPEIILPPNNMVVPFYKKFRIEAVPYFKVAQNDIPGPIQNYDVELLPPIPVPIYQKTNLGIQFILQIPKRQAKLYEEIELLHNGWPQNLRTEHIDKEDEELTVFWWQEELDLFENHQFAFRILITNLGWRTGQAVVIVPPVPSITELSGYEEEWGVLNLQWRHVKQSQLLCYQVSCDGQVVDRVKTAFCPFALPLAIAVTKDKVEVSVVAVYSNGRSERLSAPVNTVIKIAHSKRLAEQVVHSKVTPFSVTFSLENTQTLENLASEILLQRRAEPQEPQESPSTIDRQEVQSSVILTDSTVTMGKTYKYCLNLGETGGCLLEKTVTIPEINIICSLQHVGYEDVVWEIRIPPETANYLHGQLEVVRSGENSQQSHLFSWSNDEGAYDYEDKDLIPGGEYHYTLIVHWQGRAEPYYRDMGLVKTKQFEMQESIEVFYNKAVIRWTPSPLGQIEAIEIYDTNNRFIAATKSDSITLENLEPQREYRFPLKYRYSPKKIRDGKVILFKTLAYTINTQVLDVTADSLRIRWDIPDNSIARRVREFVLVVSGIEGKFILSPGTRTVYLKQLYPGTEYIWQLGASLKSGSFISLASEKTVTQIPPVELSVEVDLVHHIQWSFTPSPAVDKIQIYRNDTLILLCGATDAQEVYDSGFKAGEETTYQLYYILKDERRILAGEKKVKALNLSELVQLVQPEAGIGSIRWDYKNYKKFKYLKYIELYRNGNSIDKKGNHLPNLTFEDFGDLVGQDYQGLPATELSYELDIVGVAPTGPKCKRKWSLKLRGLQCDYANQPEGFTVSPEYGCIYFGWNTTPTPLLQQICLRRNDTNTLLYQGINQPAWICDDDDEQGLNPDSSYSYTLEMIYRNHRTSCELEVSLENPDLTRLNFQRKIIANVLEITWDSDIPSSLTQIGWKRIPSQWFKKTLGNLFQKTVWIPYAAGMLVIPLSSSKEFYYQLVYQDRYGHTLEAEAEQVTREIGATPDANLDDE